MQAYVQAGLGCVRTAPCRTGGGSSSTRAGSLGVIAADAINDHGMGLAEWEPPCKDRLQEAAAPLGQVAYALAIMHRHQKRVRVQGAGE